MSDLLSVRDLVVDYRAGRHRVRALDAVSLDIPAGQTLGLVGESGSGKTTLGRAILGLTPVTAGTITFDGADITRLPAARRRDLGRQIQAVFQDPYGSLNPALRVSAILGESLRAAGPLPLPTVMFRSATSVAAPTTARSSSTWACLPATSVPAAHMACTTPCSITLPGSQSLVIRISFTSSRWRESLAWNRCVWPMPMCCLMTTKNMEKRLPFTLMRPGKEPRVNSGSMGSI